MSNLTKSSEKDTITLPYSKVVKVENTNEYGIVTTLDGCLYVEYNFN